MAMLAHQGGWDEVLFVATPIVLLAVLLWRAKHRAEAEAEAEADGIGGADTGAAPRSSGEPDR